MTYQTFDDIFERFTYPAGESHLQLREDQLAQAATVIEATATTFDDICHIVTADRVLRRNGILVTWFVPYFPFARHDRRNHAGDGFELGLALELVAELDMVIADPHSDVTSQLPHFDQAAIVEVFGSQGIFDDDPIVVIPDAGAEKKAYDWLAALNVSVVQALKHRDPATGKLSGFRVIAEDLGGRPCLIVDDICDGGGTFLGLAAELNKHNAGPLTLAVTHGLFTKGTEALEEAFDHIVCFEPTTHESSRTEPANTESSSTAGVGKDGVTRIPFEVLYEKGTIQ